MTHEDLLAVYRRAKEHTAVTLSDEVRLNEDILIEQTVIHGKSFDVLFGMYLQDDELILVLCAPEQDASCHTFSTVESAVNALCQVTDRGHLGDKPPRRKKGTKRKRTAKQLKRSLWIYGGYAAAALAVMIFLYVFQFKPLQYEDLERKEYTFKSYEVVEGGTAHGTHYQGELKVRVAERDGYLHMPNLEKETFLESLRSGDPIVCYVTGEEDYLKIAEISSEDAVLYSLERYNEERKQGDTILYCIFLLNFVIVFCGMGDKLRALRKLKKEDTPL